MSAFGSGVPRPAAVTAVAVSLTVLAPVNALMALITLSSTVRQVPAFLADRDEPAAAHAGGGSFIAFTLVVTLLSLGAAPIILSGAVAMLRGRSGERVPRLGAVAALVPVLSCCFVAGIPLGIWGLLVLRRPETVAWLARRPAPPTAQRYGI